MILEIYGEYSPQSISRMVRTHDLGASGLGQKPMGKEELDIIRDRYYSSHGDLKNTEQSRSQNLIHSDDGLMNTERS